VHACQVNSHGFFFSLCGFENLPAAESSFWGGNCQALFLIWRRKKKEIKGGYFSWVARHLRNKQVVLTDELKVCQLQKWEVLTPLTAEGRILGKKPGYKMIEGKHRQNVQENKM
jgi:hypothetical protein